MLLNLQLPVVKCNLSFANISCFAVYVFRITRMLSWTDLTLYIDIFNYSISINGFHDISDVNLTKLNILKMAENFNSTSV